MRNLILMGCLGLALAACSQKTSSDDTNVHDDHPRPTPGKPYPRARYSFTHQENTVISRRGKDQICFKSVENVIEGEKPHQPGKPVELTAWSDHRLTFGNQPVGSWHDPSHDFKRTFPSIRTQEGYFLDPVLIGNFDSTKGKGVFTGSIQDPHTGKRIFACQIIYDATFQITKTWDSGQ